MITNIAGMRECARRRLPRALFEYADRGSYGEFTLASNRNDLDALLFCQRVLVDVSHLTLSTTILGETKVAPFGIAPVGLLGLFYPDGEIHAARAAQNFGVPFCLSTMSICSIEEVRASVTEPFWFQLYVLRDRGLTRELIERANAAQCPALLLTVDMPVRSRRHHDIANGFGVPPRINLPNTLDVIRRPRWVLGALRTKRRSFGNFGGKFDVPNCATGSQWLIEQFDPALSWQDIDRIRAEWPGKLILKGILNIEDAKAAVSAGADAIVVSNHGGRQLDGAPSSISILPEIVQAIGGASMEIFFDGGVTSGQDVLKALALGARACLLGRAFVYAIAAAGATGVVSALRIISEELATSMALTGVTDLTHVSRNVLRHLA